jgi:Ca-activated chloride channel family protein
LLVAVAILAGVGGLRASGGRLLDLLLTRDQQGRWLFERARYAEAAQRFEDPYWRGAALYLDQRFEAAIAEFARLDTPQAWFARGNALAHLEQYEDAIVAYQRVLELDPDYAAAAKNIEYLQPFLPLEFTGGRSDVLGRDGDADDVVFDQDNPKLDEEGREVEIDGEQSGMTADQLAALWLDQVETRPADFLRRKFALQLRRSGEIP